MDGRVGSYDTWSQLPALSTLPIVVEKKLKRVKKEKNAEIYPILKL